MRTNKAFKKGMTFIDRLQAEKARNWNAKPIDRPEIPVDLSDDDEDNSQQIIQV